MAKNVSSDCLPQQIRALIALFVFVLHCVFSNDVWDHLPNKMHSCTRCIYWTFPHCELSYVQSSHVSERMNSYTSCIYSVFLHFWGHGMQSCTDCTCWTFLHCDETGVVSLCDSLHNCSSYVHTCISPFLHAWFRYVPAISAYHMLKMNNFLPCTLKPSLCVLIWYGLLDLFPSLSHNHTVHMYIHNSFMNTFNVHFQCNISCGWELALFAVK